MAYSEYINTERIEQFNLDSYVRGGTWFEGDGSIYSCQDHAIILVENDLHEGGLIFGCLCCGYREEWEPN